MPEVVPSNDAVLSPLLCCGPDDRYPIPNTTSFPHSAVCKVAVAFSSGNVYIGSAVMVGPRHALTAGHVVFNEDEGGWASAILVAPGYDDGVSPFGYFEPSYAFAFDRYVDTVDINYDLAILEFDVNVGNTTGWLGFASLPDATLRASHLFTEGYPGDRRRGERMYGADGSCLDVANRQVYFAGTMDSAGGQSGSGVWLVEDSAPYVIGVLTFGTVAFNGGTRIADDVFDYIEHVVSFAGGPPPEPANPPLPGSVETLGIQLGRSRLRDSFYPGEDSVRLSLTYFFDDDSEDFLMNPIGDGFSLQVISNGDVIEDTTIPPLSFNWRVRGRRKAIWKGISFGARRKITVDVVKRTVTLRVDFTDFGGTITDPISVSVATGNDLGVNHTDWVVTRPGIYEPLGFP